MRLYVGNLAYSTTEDTLRNEFGKFGNVTSALVVIDRVSGRSRGFGFVEFSTPDEGTQAINGMNGQSLDGREIVVNEARERQAGGGEMSLARLRAGDVFGEMSLLTNQPTTATVTAARPSTILFLASEYFQRLVQALPAIRQYFEGLAQRRDIETRLAVGQEEESQGRHTSPDARVIV